MHPSGPGDAVCFRKDGRKVGGRLFRRPLSEEEMGALPRATELRDRNEQTRFARFLYRRRAGANKHAAGPGVPLSHRGGDTAPGARRLSARQIRDRHASCLSVLGQCSRRRANGQAASDRLLDPAVRKEQAERLLADPRAKEQIHRFHAMWLGYRTIPHPAELTAAFNLETTKLIDRVVFDEPQSYLELFLSPRTYLNDLLADQYGLPHPPGGKGWVDYAASGRAGILSHGSVLAAFSKFSDTSPTQRGIFVQTRLLCNEVRPPPANVNVDQPPGGGNAVCKADRYAGHRSSQSCGACHNQLDPVGFGLENYDVGGRYRTHDDGHTECPIDGAGELPGFGAFHGPGELARMLVDSKALEPCFVTQLVGFALGRPVGRKRPVTVAGITESFQANGYSLTDLLVSYAASERFVLRAEEVVP